MDTKRLVRRGLAAVMVGAWLSAIASAEEFTFTSQRGDLINTVVPGDPFVLGTNAADGLIPKFNPEDGRNFPGLGPDATLSAVRVDIEITLRSNIIITNGGPSTATVTVTQTAPFQIDSPIPVNGGIFSASGMLERVEAPVVLAGQTIEAGVLDISDSDCFRTGSSSGGCQTNSLEAIESVVVGDGTLAFPVMIAPGTCLAQGPPVFTAECQAKFRAKVTVTYVVGPPCPKINRRRCSSLLIFPEFDNRYGVRTIATVTNKNPDEKVCLHYLYIGRRDHYGYLDCEEFDRHECLTPNDTLTIMTNEHNPQHEQGFFYVYAIDEYTHDPIIANDLIGHLLVVDGLDIFEYAINPIDYRAIVEPGEMRGDPTDKDGDGIRDLNGREYEKTPCELLIPRFLGQKEHLESKLIFIGLSGGARFTTTADILLYNDNEQAFSTSHTFRCWDKVELLDISKAFRNEFLQSTNDDYYEKLGYLEYGWMRITGRNAHSTYKDILDPAIYAVFIEVNNKYAAADLPFERCNNKNGHLFPRKLSGDNEE